MGNKRAGELFTLDQDAGTHGQTEGQSDCHTCGGHYSPAAGVWSLSHTSSVLPDVLAYGGACMDDRCKCADLPVV